MIFSILVANYNNGHFFEDCYESILAQSYTNWEVIIVDDGSTDNSVSIIEKLIKDDSRFKLFKNEKNFGCGYTKMRCVTLANGEICGFLDPDDAIMSDALELMVESHKNNLNASLVHSSFIYCDEYLEPISKFSLARWVLPQEKFTNLDGRVTHFVSFKLSHYYQTNGINSQMFRAVDQDLYLKLWEVGSFVFLDRHLYKYRIHGGGIASKNSNNAFYFHLKALFYTELRRTVSFENEIAHQLATRALRAKLSGFDMGNLENPKYLIGKTIKLFLHSPVNFFRNLIRK